MSNKNSMINGLSLLLGAVCAVFAFLARAVSGSPLDIIHKLYGLELLPPIWLFNFLSVAWSFLIGAAAGAVIYGAASNKICGAQKIGAYIGLCFFLVSFFMSIIWYPLLFSAEALFLSFVASILVVLSAVLCAVNWFGAKVGIPAIIMSAYAICSFYLFIVNVAILFGI
jgi:hypothetical protein